ncbi:phosphoesterase PA-phosphatase related [Anaeromyxobacter dehalogenans 2CP-1]|uniref:Phosphoesterase PA-phosphatase related n=1 Tax=Anaeromyxobacter dehalogenans (strain ATCC BAA-258 / DSM 21875 / 2CP-1) TaxID=455488 RepID=B8JBY5_ANAD2|nr:phosphatase PAP2 family protein [Anaeromyxobacter dehalogenans]ACL63907.1 phosphoesterase PA-phosphatase related [Anaeromyxobacter dehalogenans 2CP-1]
MRRHPLLVPSALAAALALAAVPAPARPAPADLQVNVAADGAVTAAAFAAALGVRLLERDLLPVSCRWCSPGRLDAWAHRTLAWKTASRAATASDLLGVGVPLGATAALAVPDLAAGAPRRAAEDALLVAEAVSIATLGTELVKVGTDRIRPDAWDGSGPVHALDSRLSFWSGHTATAFAAVAAAGTIATLRDAPAAPWIVGGGAAAASAVGYLRLAADRHWATDVLAGAGWGTAVGILVPLLHWHPIAHVRLMPSPGGIAGEF